MITGDRNQYVAAHVTKPVKRALLAISKRDRLSVSKLIFQILLRDRAVKTVVNAKIDASGAKV